MSDINLDHLNKKYEKLLPGERIQLIFEDFDKVLITSSFGTTSAMLLHMILQKKPEQVIHFIDTTYHFEETIQYKNDLTDQLNLKVDILKGEKWKNDYTNNFKVWEKDPDICCSINKVEPVDRIKGDYDIWVSGLMHWQNSNRKNLKIFERKNDIIKFYPLIDVDENQLNEYYEKHSLPQHPLKVKGFDSVGCFHCTKQGKRREGRWVNFFKSECGLHI